MAWLSGSTGEIKGYYGSDAKQNRFPGPKGEKYFTLVNKDTGEIELWNEEWLADRKVGTLNPKSKQWTFTSDDKVGGCSDASLGPYSRCFEIEYFKNKQKEVINNAAKVVEKDLITGSNLETSRKEEAFGTSEEEVAKARHQAAEIVGVNSADQPENRDGDQTLEDITDLDMAIKNPTARHGTRKGAGSFGTHVYPEGLRNSDQDIIKFDMLEYSPRELQTTKGNLKGLKERTGFEDRSTLGTVVLPIPGGIRDQNRVEWGPSEANPWDLLAGNILLNSLNRNLTKTLDGVKDAAEDNTTIESIKKGLSFAIIDSATGGKTRMLTRTTGAVFNPNMELLFNKPSLRPFTFTFRLTPREPKEATSILKIIRFFKQGMAPIRSESQLFLKSPHTFRLRYIHAARAEHKALNRFKECALTAFNVEYTPDGNYATYPDGVMTSYEISLNFQELTPIYNDDYENEDVNASGAFSGGGPLAPSKVHDAAGIGF